MKVISANNVKYIAGIALMVTGATAAAIYRDNKIIDNMKQEILQKDSLRYQRALDEEKNLSQHNKTYFWINERDRMNDSIKTSSIAQKAYFEGMQAIRDSIKNAENNK